MKKKLAGHVGWKLSDTICKLLKIKKGGHNVPVGIKNSWKYEKDLIIFNENKEVFTISRTDRS